MSVPLVSFARVAAADLAPRRLSAALPEAHLLAAESWLCRAQDVNADGGVSYGYSIKGGWRPSYPETTGYITTTFLRLARARDPAYRARAERALRWLCSVQNPDGSFANPRYGQDGIVFDTGQVLFGLVSGYQETKLPVLLDSARRAADWLVGIADAERRWTRSEHKGVPHVYNTRTAWALLRMHQLEPESAREAVARSNLDWALSEQNAGGYFEHCSFEPGLAPYTHTIAYTARGLLESGALLGDDRYVDAAARCARAVLGHLRADGWLPSKLTTAGAAAASSCCVTGNCQFAIVWSRLHALGVPGEFRVGALRALDYVMSTQDIETGDPGRRGGIKGSHPVWGSYACLSYPNWAAKFFVDAMWLRKDL